jgi:hypothetical protein
MAKFYISFQKTMARDEEGLDLLGLEEARTVAMASARELLADDVKSVSSDPLVAVIVTDGEGRELLRIPAKDVLPERLR